MTRARPQLPTLAINGEDVPLNARETVLSAALRGGIDFPYSCRVGGCGSCKCKLTAGEVQERTETGYLLSAEELAAGYILACQSVPRGDVSIQVELPAQTARVRGRGQVTGQRKLTADITELAVQLDAPIAYRAGQFAELSFLDEPSLVGVVRPYSFASKPSPDGQVRFFVRKVPGGRFSSFVHDGSLLGARM